MQSGVDSRFRELVVATGLEMLALKMTVGTWGNISVRDPETGLVYISPSGVEYKDIRACDVPVLDDRTNVVDGEMEPSVEKHMHCSVYRARSDVNAVIHTHPVYSSVFGSLEQDIIAVSEDFAQIVGDKVINALPYKLPGTEELAMVAVEALGDRNAVILPSHGALAVGKDMKQAIKVGLVLEKNAKIYMYARLLGEPRMFSQEEITAMQDYVRDHYGKKNQALRDKM